MSLKDEFKFDHTKEGDWQECIGVDTDTMDNVAIKMSMCCNDGINNNIKQSEMTEMILNLFTPVELVLLGTICIMEKIELILSENPEMVFMQEIKNKARDMGIEIGDGHRNFDSVKERYLAFKEKHKDRIQEAKLNAIEKAKNGEENKGYSVTPPEGLDGIIEAFKKIKDKRHTPDAPPKPYIKKES